MVGALPRPLVERPEQEGVVVVDEACAGAAAAAAAAAKPVCRRGDAIAVGERGDDTASAACTSILYRVCYDPPQ